MTCNKNKTETRIYTGADFGPAEVLEMYCKFIADKGPFNIFYEKEISWNCDPTDMRRGLSHSTIGGFSSPHIGYIAVQLMTSKPKLQKCTMSRQKITLGSKREITLENIADGTKVTVYDSKGKTAPVFKLADSYFGNIEEKRKDAQAFKKWLSETPDDETEED